MKLIKEINESVQTITESNEAGQKEYFIEGIFLQSEIKNRNGRMYPEKTMDMAVEKYIKNYVEGKRAYGELGHPDNPSINLDRVSHLITSLRKEGANYIGKAKILNTPMGNIARGLLEGGAQLGVSSRALGSLRTGKNGVQVVQDDFVLSTAADIVADPSAPDAFVQGIMEGHEWVYVDGKYVEKQIEETKKLIGRTSSARLDEVSLKAFDDFLKSIK
jgi:hypothetical protein